jgi:spermidine synthase
MGAPSPDDTVSQAGPEEDTTAEDTTAEVTHAEVARAETERGELVLRRRTREGAPDVLELRVNGVFVMDTLETGSEIEMAALALGLVPDPRDVVVGGLGLGFTTQRVLADPRVERVTVVEIEEPLIAWMRDGTVPHGPALLADRRLQVVNADISMAVAEARRGHDLLLLDVDNGPNYLVHGENVSLYEDAFLAQCQEMLNPGGALVVWSADVAPDLADGMRRVFGDVRETSYDVLLQDRPETYHLYSAQRG